MKCSSNLPRLIFLMVGCVGCLIPQLGRSEWMTLMPSEYAESRVLDISGRERTYFSIEKGKPLKVEVKGPTQIRILTRLEFATEPSQSAEYSVLCVMDTETPEKVAFNSRPITTVRDNQQSKRLLGYLRTHSIDVPAGVHSYAFQVNDYSQRIWLRVQEKKAEYIENLQRVAIQPQKYSKAVDLEVKEKITTYYLIGGNNEVQIEVIGPTNLQLLTRLEYDSTMRGTQKFRLQVLEGNRVMETYSFSTELSDVSHYIERSSNLLSRGEKVSLDVPAGSHSYRIVLLDENRTALIKFLIPIKDLGNEL